MAARYTPSRGDIVWIDFAPTVGHEQSGHRPALVLSANLFNIRTGLAMVVPITSKLKKYDIDVSVEAGKIKGIVMPYQARFIDWKARGVYFEARAGAKVIEDTLDILHAIMDEDDKDRN